MKKISIIIGIINGIFGAGLFGMDPPATHGMLVIGTHKTYAYHLPMFHIPHDYQVIFEISFDKNTMQTYLSQKAQSPDTLFTLVPERMVLPDLAKNPRPVMATLFQGHFEQGGTPITRLVKVAFAKALVFNKLNAQTEKPDTYRGLFFGNEKELFLAHGISGAPDFDQIV